MLPRFGLGLALALGALAPQWGRDMAAAPALPGHIYVIMEENTDYNDIVGNTADAPYLNSLIASQGFAANYYGVTHPSLPNYVAATAGDFFGSHSDDPTQTFNHTNVVDQIETAGKSWAAYMQSMPSAGFAGTQYPSNAALYVVKHNPFMLFPDIASNPARTAKIKPIESLASDLATGTAPNFVWISPDECHDMHGLSPSQAQAVGMSWCAYPPTNTPSHALIQAGDQYAKTLVTEIEGSKAWTSDSAIVITWDENDYAGATGNFGYGSATGCCGSPAGAGGGRVPTIVVTPAGNHTVSLQAYNHYSLLKTIEDALGLSCLNHTCDASVHTMADLFAAPSGTPTSVAATRGFAVTFSSTNPGQGYVLFGPSCSALVETATRDLGAGTTTHTVLVTGNDMPGTIGDVGLTPGATYAYEVVTVSAAGREVDNNGGACYTTTIEKP